MTNGLWRMDSTLIQSEEGLEGKGKGKADTKVDAKAAAKGKGKAEEGADKKKAKVEAPEKVSDLTPEEWQARANNNKIFDKSLFRTTWYS